MVVQTSQQLPRAVARKVRRIRDRRKAAETTSSSELQASATVGFISRAVSRGRRAHRGGLGDVLGGSPSFAVDQRVALFADDVQRSCFAKAIGDALGSPPLDLEFLGEVACMKLLWQTDREAAT